MYVMNEMIVNAIRHGAGEEFIVDVRVDIIRRRVLIEVYDESTDLPTRRQAGEYDENGRGMELADHYVIARGVELTGQGKRVWAKLGLPD